MFVYEGIWDTNINGKGGEWSGMQPFIGSRPQWTYIKLTGTARLSNGLHLKQKPRTCN